LVTVVTGMVGIDKKRYLERVCDLARSAGKTVTLCNVGDMMYAEAPDIAPGHILDMPLARLRGLRRSVFKDIIARRKDCENLIINTHATFRWRHGLFVAFDFDQMRQLDADMYICLIDSADALHIRLSSEHPIQHSLKDLLVWREEEILATEMMQQGVNADSLYYCLSRGTGEGTFEACYRLIFERRRKKAYLSFPMTHVMDMPDLLAEIGGFRDLMKQQLTCFDPGDLEEMNLPYYARKAVEAGRECIELNSLDQKVRFDLGEVQRIETDIMSQVYTRDFALIDQADMIISYIPHISGRAVISSGVERELQHAHEAGKGVYVVWLAPSEPSVFIIQTATKIFASAEEAIGFFKDKGYAG